MSDEKTVTLSGRDPITLTDAQIDEANQLRKERDARPSNAVHGGRMVEDGGGLRYLIVDGYTARALMVGLSPIRENTLVTIHLATGRVTTLRPANVTWCA